MAQVPAKIHTSQRLAGRISAVAEVLGRQAEGKGTICSLASVVDQFRVRGTKDVFSMNRRDD